MLVPVTIFATTLLLLARWYHRFQHLILALNSNSLSFGLFIVDSICTVVSRLRMTYIVSSGALNSTHSLTHCTVV